jgi:hypothetical protein
MKKAFLIALVLLCGTQLYAQNRNYGPIDSTHAKGKAPAMSAGKTKLVKSGSEPQEEDSTYTSSTWKFSILIPANWDYVETKTTQSNVPLRILSPLNYETVDIYKTDLKDNFRENVSVETMNIGDDSLNTFYNVTFNSFKSYYEGFLEQEKGLAKNGKWFIFQFVGNGELKMKCFVGCYVVDGVGYKIIAVGEDRKFDQYYEDFKNIILSFQPVK